MQSQAASVKCSQCGLVYWATEAACRRCNTPSGHFRQVQTPHPIPNQTYKPHQWSEDVESERAATIMSHYKNTPAAFGDATALQQAPAAPVEQTKQCPFCAETILAAAIKCRFCNEIVDVTRRQAQAPMPAVYQNVQVNTVPVYHQTARRVWSPGTAALLSFIVPGLGQLYKGNPGSGILWFFGVFIGYVCFILPGLILHLICICSASSGDPTKLGG